MNPFIKKGYGRVFVTDESHIEKVKEAMKEVDAYEFIGYFPQDLVTLFAGNGQDLIYTHKFEMDIDKLTELCWTRGIWIWCVSQHNDPFPY